MTQSDSRSSNCEPFLIDEKPYAYWDLDTRNANLTFLRGIDHRHLTYVAETHGSRLDCDKDAHRAAQSLRIGYSQGLETFMALYCALIQAPRCAIGWLLQYKLPELRAVVRKIVDRKQVPSALNIPPQFESLSRSIHAHQGHASTKADWIASGFAGLWNRFATDFLNDKAHQEYNSAKHGLRCKPGGFALSMGLAQGLANGPSNSDMQLIGKSDFGTAFFVPIKIGSDRINFQTRRLHRNWSPTNFQYGLRLLDISIQNVISMHRVLNGESPSDCTFSNPETPDLFDAPWADSCSVTDFQMGTIIQEGWISPLKKEDVLKAYPQTNMP